MYKSSRVMSDGEITRWLRKFQHDPEFRDTRGVKTVPIAFICSYAGVSRRAVYYFLLGARPLGEMTRLRLTDAILAVQDGLRWKKRRWGMRRPGRPVLEKRSNTSGGG